MTTNGNEIQLRVWCCGGGSLIHAHTIQFCATISRIQFSWIQAQPNVLRACVRLVIKVLTAAEPLNKLHSGLFVYLFAFSAAHCGTIRVYNLSTKLTQRAHFRESNWSNTKWKWSTFISMLSIQMCACGMEIAANPSIHPFNVWLVCVPLLLLVLFCIPSNISIAKM